MLEKMDFHVQNSKIKPDANVNSKWIKHLNLITKTRRFLEEYIREWISS